PALASGPGGGQANLDVGGGDPFLGELYQLWTGAKPEAHAAFAQATLASLGGQVAIGRAEAGTHAADLCTRVDAEVAARTSQVDGAVAQARAQVAAGFAQARAQVEAGAQAALAEIEGHAVTALASIDSAITTQTGALDTGFDAEAKRLAELRTTTLAAFNTAFDTEIGNIRQVGEKKAGEATATGNSKASAYLARGGEDIEADRNRARHDAAKKVAADYAARMREEANKIADEISAGKASLGQQVDDMINPASDALTQQLADAKAQLVGAAEQARAQVEQQRAALNASIETARAQGTSQLAGEEQASLADLDARGATVKQNLLASGEALKQQIRGCEGSLNTAFDAMLASLQDTVTGEGVPDKRELSQGALAAEAQLETDRAAALGQMDQIVDAGFGQLDADLQRGLAAIADAATQAAAAAGEAANSAVAAMSESAASAGTSLAELASGFSGQVSEITTGVLEGARGLVDNTAKGAEEAKAGMVAQLGDVKGKVESSLAQALTKLPSDISTTAESEASKIQPWWKKALAIVAAVIVVAVILIATAGTAGLLAGVLIGAACAVGAKLAYDMSMWAMTGVKPFDNLGDYLVELGTAALIGAITGGAGAMIGSGGALAGFSFMGKVGVMGGASFLSSLIDQVVDVAYFKEGWNWGEFFLNGAVGTVLSAIGLGIGQLVKAGPSALQKSLTTGPSSNSWNNFQRNFAKLVPWSTTPGGRSAVYNALKNMVGASDDIARVVEGVANELMTKTAENNPTGNGPGLTADPEKGPAVISAVASPGKVKDENVPKVKVPAELVGKKK
ncbi:MAG: hypothetical protein FJ102_08605, partial [Deltaproteobacteria bacterium]|nr:hypothetical protein [Deltaproteobacteria bacterium]